MASGAKLRPDAVDSVISIVPANEASRRDLTLVFGTRGDPVGCQCQWFLTTPDEWRSLDRDERAARFTDQTQCGQPDAVRTSGLVAYLDGEPVGWCAVEPRIDYVRLANKRIVWSGRHEDPEDEGIWAVTCFVTRTGFRKRGISRALAAATVDFAHDRGARAIEGYPMIVEPGKEIAWGELFVGSRSVFADAGFREVSHPTPRRVVMRIDF